MISSDLEKINNHSANLEQVFQAADIYSKSCRVGCRVIDQMGSTVYLTCPEQDQMAICEMAGAVLPGGRNEDSKACSHVCDNAHLYGCYQAERFGGQYIYFCPVGMTHWASPVLQDGQVVAALIGGPVHMVDPDDFLIDELVARNGIHPDNIARMRQEMDKIPVLETEQVNALSGLLYLVACSVSDDSFQRIKQSRDSNDLQAQIWEQIEFMNSYAHIDEKALAYPIEKEAQLLEMIEIGDKSGSQRILNEIMGHIFFSSSGSLEIIRARVIELVVLLSRAAIRGGADVQQIFGLNYMYLSKINTFRNIDEIAYWLSGIMARFTDHVFNLTNVKHADVIYRAVDYIKRNYMNKLTLEETAAHVFLSPAYFSRIFKEEMGDNFNVYVNHVRIEAAKKLLLNEKIALVDISTLVGFEGQSYFSKVFKKLTGTTPGKFRESRGKKKPLK